MRSTILGLAIVAAIVGGTFWARHRTLPIQGATAGSSAYSESVPDVSRTAATVDDGGVRVTASLAPAPPAAFSMFRIRVQTRTAGGLTVLQGGRVSFEMRMPMGEHRYGLKPTSDGWQEADVMLPSCPSGQFRWYATIEGDVAGRPRKVRVRFDLAPSAR